MWTRSINSDGYGEATQQGRSWKAHRLAWTLARGAIPDDLEIDHICFNRACINPEHLQLLTRAENARRRKDGLVECCPRGHRYDDPEHLRLVKQGRKLVRTCRTCLNAQARARYAPTPRQLSTHCGHGHEYTPENTYVAPGLPNRRFCITCGKRRHEERKARKAQ